MYVHDSLSAACKFFLLLLVWCTSVPDNAVETTSLAQRHIPMYYSFVSYNETHVEAQLTGRKPLTWEIRSSIPGPVELMTYTIYACRLLAYCSAIQ